VVHLVTCRSTAAFTREHGVLRNRMFRKIPK
jgi:hypothetical protein